MNTAIGNTLKTVAIAIASAFVFGFAVRTGFQSEQTPAR